MTDRSPSLLTLRQAEVLSLLAMGHTADEIGKELEISARTARAHIDVLKRKLGANRSRDLPFAYRRTYGADPVMLAERLRESGRPE